MSFLSFQIAVTGMKANQENLAVIGNNIANVNTDGYKGANYQFKDLLSQQINSPLSQSVNVNELGFGAKGITTNKMNQGMLTPVASDKDIGIDGEGFFILANGHSTEYTRAGNFRPMEYNDKIVLGDGHSGFMLQGWNATYPFDNTSPVIETTDKPTNIELQLGTLERGRASNYVTLIGNLDADEPSTNEENIITSLPLTNGASPASASTNLKDLTASSTSQAKIFPNIDSENGVITLNAIKGGANISENFVYGKDGTTVGDFLAWAQNALGLQKLDSTDSLYNPTGISLNTDGSIQFASGIGQNAQIRSIALSYKSDKSSNNIPNFVASMNPNKAQIKNHSMIVYDAEGKEHSLDISFTKINTDSNGTKWSYNIESTDNFKAKGERLIASGTIQFDTNGQEVAFNPNLATFEYIGDDGSTHSQTLNLDMKKLTQFSSAQGSDISTSTDGFPRGLLVDYYVDDNGTVIGKFDNGYTEEVAKIALASFVNSENLNRSANGNWQLFNSEQAVTISESGKTKAGVIKSRVLEQSNVDLTTELSKLIVAQRSFQSVSNALQVSNEMLRDLSRLGG